MIRPSRHSLERAARCCKRIRDQDEIGGLMRGQLTARVSRMNVCNRSRFAHLLGWKPSECAVNRTVCRACHWVLRAINFFRREKKRLKFIIILSIFFKKYIYIFCMLTKIKIFFNFELYSLNREKRQVFFCFFKALCRNKYWLSNFIKSWKRKTKNCSI